MPPQDGTSELAADAVLAEAVRAGWRKALVLPPSAVPPRSPVALTANILEQLERDGEDR